MGLSLSDIPGVNVVSDAAHGDWKGAAENAFTGGLYGPVSHAVGGVTAKGPPGVGGPAEDPSRLRFDPQTNMWVDPVTNTAYIDATGQQPIHDPHVSQQVAQNWQERQKFLNQGQADRGIINQAQAGQTGLASSLNNTINNPNATSVAGSQLTEGNDVNGRTQLALAAGQGGANAAAGRRQAAQNIGQAGAQLDQSQALLRADETAKAQGQLGQVYGNMANQGINLSGQDNQNAGNFASLSQSGAGGLENLNVQTQKDNQNMALGGLNGLSGAGQKLAMGGTNG